MKLTQEKVNKLQWYSDPGHGWLKVPLGMIGDFKPSNYSYKNATHAYLEEDCDAGGWAIFHDVDIRNLKENVSSRSSRIRNLKGFNQ